MTNNFTDRNKHSDHNKSGDGARINDMSVENGYGRPELSKIMDGTGGASYTSGPNRAMIDNENFMDERFAGDGVGGQPRINASNAEKDSIETGGGGGDDLNRKAY